MRGHVFTAGRHTEAAGLARGCPALSVPWGPPASFPLPRATGRSRPWKSQHTPGDLSRRSKIRLLNSSPKSYSMSLRLLQGGFCQPPGGRDFRSPWARTRGRAATAEHGTAPGAGGGVGGSTSSGWESARSTDGKTEAPGGASEPRRATRVNDAGLTAAPRVHSGDVSEKEERWGQVAGRGPGVRPARGAFGVRARWPWGRLGSAARDRDARVGAFGCVLS